MNNQRRAKIRKAIKKIDKVKDMIAEVTDFIEDVRMEEEEMFDNLPDWKQTLELGINSEEAARDMQEAMDELSYADTDLETATDRLKEAIDG